MHDLCELMALSLIDKVGEAYAIKSPSAGSFRYTTATIEDLREGLEETTAREISPRARRAKKKGISAQRGQNCGG
jgi:hypothetical protein